MATEARPTSAKPRGKYLAILSLTSLGVVYGDIGTSPLYAVREAFFGPHAVATTPANILGVLSLIFWSLLIVISVKYLVFVLRADNHGEGGILALASLVTTVNARRGDGRWLLLLLGLFGAALLYGDGMITPAISVLSAMEGLEVATPALEPYVIPLTVLILIGLFLFQSRGTAGVGIVFGPITLVWFLTLAVIGVAHIVQQPGVLAAVSPLHALDFFLRNEWRGFLVLGAVFLVVTGGEALYADLGHFGPRPIRLTWFSVVLPALLLNYFGQGALLLGNPEAAVNPFFRSVPDWAVYPLVILAAMATVIASQAVISGAFSLTMQAVQFGYSPRLTIHHTSAREYGQIYLPAINWALMVACIGLVVGFRSSSNLAAAYGVAVTSTMVITTLLFFVVARERWKWSLPVAALLSGFFLIIDLAFFGANILKIPQGGWFPLVMAGIVFTVMATWRRGRQILAQRLTVDTLPPEEFIRAITTDPPTRVPGTRVFVEPPPRVPGTAVFMTSSPGGVPPALLHNLTHNKVLHERVVFLTVDTEEVPRVPAKHRAEVRPLGDNFHQIILRYGYMENPNVPLALASLSTDGESFELTETTYFLGHETLVATDAPGMAIWRERLFAFMSRNAKNATEFFGIPPDRVIELGVRVEL